MNAAPTYLAPPRHHHSHAESSGAEHRHAHGPAHAHAPSDVHAHGGGSGHHHHSHLPGERHPAAQLSPSLLRASLAQRLAIVIPVAALLWALALWVIQGGGA